MLLPLFVTVAVLPAQPTVVSSLVKIDKMFIMSDLKKDGSYRNDSTDTMLTSNFTQVHRKFISHHSTLFLDGN